jgi:hypothetical protein
MDLGKDIVFDIEVLDGFLDESPDVMVYCLDVQFRNPRPHLRLLVEKLGQQVGIVTAWQFGTPGP